VSPARSGQGALAPVAASAALFGTYLVLKWLPELNLQTLFNAYFWLVGAVAVASGVATPLRRTARPPSPRLSPARARARARGASLFRVGDAQAGGLGEASIDVQLPPWLLLGDDRVPITRARLAPSDVAAGLFGLGAASADLASGHTIFGLNNMIACLLATDILQARARAAEGFQGFE